MSECQTVRSRSGLIWVQTVSKGCQKATKEGKELSQGCGNTMQDLSDLVHFIQRKIEISIDLSWDMYKNSSCKSVLTELFRHGKTVITFILLK